ncbi:collagen alpha-1(I) chain-like [Elephas maximus indicus]|uniref:collagen alpha-1(I) chain-like n=1 Tax=Elephas maximus indicus TaxID=99487 RepID=UPI0021167A39|nr:collagen alpha-1(I) chain-like [Elephas maximus indicus]
MAAPPRSPHRGPLFSRRPGPGLPNALSPPQLAPDWLGPGHCLTRQAVEPETARTLRSPVRHRGDSSRTRPGCTLSVLIWPRNARYPHSVALEPRLLSPATATRAGPPHLQMVNPCRRRGIGPDALRSRDNAGSSPREPKPTRLPGPRGKRRRWSQAVSLPFIPKQSHAPTGGCLEANYAGKLRQRPRHAGSGRLPSRGHRPSTRRLLSALHLSPLPSPGHQERRSTPPLPKPPSPRVHRPPSQRLQPKAFGFRLLLGANFLPLGKAGSVAEAVGAAWSHGEGARGPPPLATGAQAARALPGAPPTPGRVPQLRSRDLGGPGPALSTFLSPRALTWLGRLGSLPWPEGPRRLRPPGSRGWGWGCPPGSATSRGWGPGTQGGGGESHCLSPPLAPPSSPPLSGGGVRNEFQMWPAGRRALRLAGAARRAPLSAPPPPALPRPAPTRENWPARDVTHLHDVQRSWPGGLNLKLLVLTPGLLLDYPCNPGMKYLLLINAASTH